MLKITPMILTNHNRPGKKLKKLKAIVLHWTANEAREADATANRNYFNSTDRACSAHFIVDDRKIVQCVPEDEIAYHVGANSYRDAGKALMEGTLTPNFFTLGIEMCVNADANSNFIYKNTVQLTANLLRKHNLTVGNLLRHYDITGKACPKQFLDDAVWNRFKEDVSKELAIVPTTPKEKPKFLRTLKVSKPMLTGEDIKAMQEQLVKEGIKCAADGVYGYETMTAVQMFQAKHGLSPDGICGVLTWTKLFE